VPWQGTQSRVSLPGIETDILYGTVSDDWVTTSKQSITLRCETCSYNLGIGKMRKDPVSTCRTLACAFFAYPLIWESRPQVTSRHVSLDLNTFFSLLLSHSLSSSNNEQLIRLSIASHLIAPSHQLLPILFHTLSLTICLFLRLVAQTISLQQHAGLHCSRSGISRERLGREDKLMVSPLLPQLPHHPSITSLLAPPFDACCH